MSLRRIAAIALTVADLDRATRFYVDALGFALVAERDDEGDGFARLLGLRGARARTVVLTLGDERIELTAFREPGAPYPTASESPDLWFQHFAMPVLDIGAAHTRLCAAGGMTPISEGGPQRLPGSSGGVTAFKFRDPDGHPLEFLQYPPGQAPAKWAHRDQGIDHSAIAVADTARSEALYVGLLGLEVASRSLNRGEEQERLDGTFNALVEVTGLELGDGPHVELLCYRVPPTGRMIPGTTRSSDIAATRLVIETTDLQALVDQAMEKRLHFVSPGIVREADGGAGAMLRDVDGHLLLFRSVA